MYNEELQNFYSSPNIRILKSKRIKLEGNVTRIRKWEIHKKFWLESLREEDHSKNHAYIAEYH
jgi:hypothetical protein